MLQNGMMVSQLQVLYLTIKYEVIQIKGDRVVIGVNGQVTGAISKNSIDRI